MIYYLKPTSTLYNYYEPGDEIEITIKRQNKRVAKESFTDVIKLMDKDLYGTSGYISQTLTEIDEWLKESKRGVSALRHVASVLKEKEAVSKTEDKMIKDGPMITFVKYIPKMLSYRENDDVQFFSMRCAVVFSGVAKILSSMSLSFDALYKKLEVKSELQPLELETNLKRAILEEPSTIVGKECECDVGTIKKPFINLGESDEVQLSVLKKCDGQYSIYSSSEKNLLGVVQFGCRGDMNDRRIFIYEHHTSTLKQDSRKISNLTFVMEQKIAINYRRCAFGLLGFSLYKAPDKIEPRLIGLEHTVPHIELPLFDGFRQKVIDIISKHGNIRSSELVSSLGEFMSKWFFENQLYKNDPVNLTVWLQAYHTHLLKSPIFQPPAYDNEREQILNIPEIYSFSHDHFNVVKACVKGLRDAYKKGNPTMMLIKDGQITMACGLRVNVKDVFQHPCFMPNMMIGKDQNVKFLPVSDTVSYRFHYNRINKKGGFDTKKSFCRLCKREFQASQYAKLCAVRDEVLKEHFIESNLSYLGNVDVLHTAVVKRMTENEMNSMGEKSVKEEFEVDNGIRLVTGVLVSEIPYKLERIKGENGKYTRRDTFSLCGTFV